MKHNGPLLLDLCMTDIQMNVIMLNKGAKQLLCKLMCHIVAYKAKTHQILKIKI